VPLPVTPWTGNTFPTAKSLNLALYSTDGSLNHPNGILFHAQRLITSEVIGARGAAMTFPSSPTGGTRTSIGTPTPFPGVSLVDTAGYYGQTSDGTYLLAGYQYISSVKGSAGDGITPGGYTIVCHFIPVSGATTTDGIGADLNSAVGVNISTGARQRRVSTNDCCPFLLDLIDSRAQPFRPSILAVDSSSVAVTVHANSTDSSGETPRFFTIWAGVSAVNAGGYGTPAQPAPFTGYTATTTIGTTGTPDVNLNGPSGIAGPMNFLSNPPLFSAGNGAVSSQSIANNTPTLVTGSSPALADNYSGWVVSTYTVQRAGLYLAHGLVPFAANSVGSRRVGLTINGTTYWGPGYPAPFAGPGLFTKTQIFSLQAGDTVQLWCEQNSGGALTIPNSDLARFFLAWLGTSGVPSTLWTPPDTSFRWSAGTQGINLPALFQQHLANDIGFLVNRPYLMAYQTSAQSGFSNNTFNLVTMDTEGGIVHGDTGDNYSGFASGVYTAPVAGWYLAVFEGFATFPTVTTATTLTAGFTVPSSGGRTPSQPVDWYQNLFPSLATYPPAATAVGLYYLLAGETIQPMLRGANYTAGTWGTQVGSGINSHLEIIWVSNLAIRYLSVSPGDGERSQVRIHGTPHRSPRPVTLWGGGRER
jgi:hypothetical protein